jgi:fluoride ion exporter CrcB/FEX
MTGTPKTISVALLLTDNTATLVATKIRAALAADTAVKAVFAVGGTGADIVLTKLAKAANDTTLNVLLDNGTCAGLTTAATSANTTAGVAPETNTLTISKNVSHALMGSVASATSVETIV